MATYRMRVPLTWPADGGPGVSVWHIRSDGTISDSAQAMVDAIGTWYEAILAGGLVCDGYRAQFTGELVDVATDEIVVVDGFDHVANGVGASFAGLASQACITMRTSVAKKSGLGRKFVGPLNMAAIQSDGSINDGIRTAAQTASDALVATSTGFADGAVCVYSTTEGLARDVVSMQVRDYVAVLRSRRD